MERNPVGFFPNELIYCLRNKVVGCNDGRVIPELEDFYAHEPWELPGLYREISNVQSDGWDWYFICPSPYVAQTREIIKRQTRSGQWKITSKWFDIKMKPTQPSIGRKRIFVFFKQRSGSLRSIENRSTGTRIRTGWLMHEYHLNPEHLGGYSSIFKIPYILCHLKRPSESLEIPPTIQRDSRVTDEISYQETMATLSPILTLDEHLPSYSLGGDFFPPLDMCGDGQISYQETTATLSPILMLDKHLPSYSLGGDFFPPLDMCGDGQIFYQETMATLSPILTLDEHLPSYSLGGDFFPPLDMCGDGQISSQETMAALSPILPLDEHLPSYSLGGDFFPPLDTHDDGQASPGFTVEFPHPDETRDFNPPDQNVPIPDQQPQTSEEQRLSRDDHRHVNEPSDGHCYKPYSPSDGIDLAGLFNYDESND